MPNLSDQLSTLSEGKWKGFASGKLSFPEAVTS